MALYVDDGYVAPFYMQSDIEVLWDKKEIFIPKDTLLLLQSSPAEIRQLDIYDFHKKLHLLQQSEHGIAHDDIQAHVPPKNISGVILARVIEIINDYTVTFEDGQYNVNIVGGNSNIADRVNKNQVGVNTANSAGLQDLSSLQAASFGDGAIAIDQVNGVGGIQYPIGTRGKPSSNWSDARAIAESRNMNKIILIGMVTAGVGDDISNLTIIGTNPMVSILAVQPEADTTNVYIKDCYFTGSLDGGTILSNCVVGDTYYFDGFIENCAISADVIQMFGTGTLLNCTEGNKVLSDPIMDMTNGDSLFVRNYSGNLVITNKITDGLVDIHIDGMLVIDASCTHGSFNIHGNGYVINNSELVIHDRTTGTPSEIADEVQSRGLATKQDVFNASQI